MSIELHGAMRPDYDEVLTPEALDFVEELHRRFDGTRRRVLAARPEGRRNLGFLEETREIREGDWTVAPVPDDMQQRWVEITGPTDRKMVINALNSGADGFMADFEDANSPTWTNMVEGQLNVRDAIDRTITHTDQDGRHYELDDEVATLLIRPRGWHLLEKHVTVGGDHVAGGLFDFGLYVFHCAPRLLRKGSGPYFYLPKMEHHREARLWDDVMAFAEEAMGFEHGTCKATVLIETLPAAFQMDEILYTLRDHSAGLNAGRWDYIFSAIKCRPDDVLPDRSDVTMTVPFMRAYTELLVATCHRRGAHAMGGMAAQIPSRKDPDAAEAALDKVREDKEREVGQGYDGTWVAHPDAVAAAREVFEQGLQGRANQLSKLRDDVAVGAGDLLNLAGTPGDITEQGLRNNVEVGFQYVSFWLTGRGAAGINGLMEDAATAEISRSQIWQWVHHGVELDTGEKVTPDLVRRVLDEETARIRDTVGEQVWQDGRPEETREVFERMCLGDELEDFLTAIAYQHLE
jgi:malate synthase